MGRLYDAINSRVLSAKRRAINSVTAKLQEEVKKRYENMKRLNTVERRRIARAGEIAQQTAKRRGANSRY